MSLPPPPPRPKRFYYCLDGTRVFGTLSGEELIAKVVERKEMPFETMVCIEGTEDWVRFTDLPDSVFTSIQLAKLRKHIQEQPIRDAEAWGKSVGSNPVVGAIFGVLVVVFLFWLFSAT